MIYRFMHTGLLMAFLFGCSSQKTRVQNGPKPEVKEKQESQQSLAPGRPMVYHSATHRCSLELPAGWSVVDAIGGRLAVFTHAEGKAQIELYHENLFVPTTSREFGLVMHERLAGTREALGREQTYGKYTAYVSSYVMNRGGRKIRYRLWSYVSGLDAFVVVAVAPENEYEAFQEMFEKIFRSFRFQGHRP